MGSIMKISINEAEKSTSFEKVRKCKKSFSTKNKVKKNFKNERLIKKSSQEVL